MNHSTVIEVATAKQEQRSAREELLVIAAHLAEDAAPHPDAVRIFADAVASYLAAEVAQEDRETGARGEDVLNALRVLKAVRR